ncbi:unnamed protein product [Triticum turgidum subsp. durum]|uniref:Uncharacterized protein n=1 Tax=Triticum turgidum subsp. durum TaxID=4567 RepID=A0A9R0RLC3_TRITD|nr:unnamed protein product [Triticum turgidum subsp. durum]
MLSIVSLPQKVPVHLPPTETKKGAAQKRAVTSHLTTPSRLPPRIQMCWLIWYCISMCWLIWYCIPIQFSGLNTDIQTKRACFYQCWLASANQGEHNNHTNSVRSCFCKFALTWLVYPAIKLGDNVQLKH